MIRLTLSFPDYIVQQRRGPEKPIPTEVYLMQIESMLDNYVASGLQLCAAAPSAAPNG